MGKKPPFLTYHMFDKAHVVMLTEQGIIPREDGVAILKAFRRMEAEGVIKARERVGGVDHSGEAYLITELGWNVGGRLHIGRSTGDLATVSLHLAQRDYIIEAMELLLATRKAMVEFAEKHVETITPMYLTGPDCVWLKLYDAACPGDDIRLLHNGLRQPAGEGVQEAGGHL